MKHFIIHFEDREEKVSGNYFYHNEAEKTFTLDGITYKNVVNIYQVFDATDMFEIVDELLEAKDQVIKMLIEKGGIDKETHNREERALERYIGIRYDTKPSRN
jgi:hypothetical protein